MKFMSEEIYPKNYCSGYVCNKKSNGEFFNVLDDDSFHAGWTEK